MLYNEPLLTTEHVEKLDQPLRIVHRHAIRSSALSIQSEHVRERTQRVAKRAAYPSLPRLALLRRIWMGFPRSGRARRCCLGHGELDCLVWRELLWRICEVLCCRVGGSYIIWTMPPQTSIGEASQYRPRMCGGLEVELWRSDVVKQCTSSPCLIMQHEPLVVHSAGTLEKTVDGCSSLSRSEIGLLRFNVYALPSYVLDKVSHSDGG